MTSSFLHRAVGLLLAAVLVLVGQVDTRGSADSRVQQGAVPSPSASAPAPSPAGPTTAPTASSTGPVPGAAAPRTTAPAPAPPLSGRDISWPNCPRGMGIPTRRTLGKPMPPPGTGFVVIGLTNGPGFFPNPCLGEQVAYARSLRLPLAAYAVVTYPMTEELARYRDAGPRSPSDRLGRLFNAGWAQAAANVASMVGTGLDSPIVWVDVEFVRPPAPWSHDVTANRAVLEGTLAAYRRAGLRVGVYSTTYQWESIVGRVRYGLPEWRAAGHQSRRAALELCRRGAIQGGRPVLVQWATPDVDLDELCPVPSGARARRLFLPALSRPQPSPAGWSSALSTQESAPWSRRDHLRDHLRERRAGAHLELGVELPQVTTTAVELRNRVAASAGRYGPTPAAERSAAPAR